MTININGDQHWQTALDWIQREHENALDESAQAELAAWLKASPDHLKAYEEARRVWLAAGLVPPAGGSI